MVIDDEPMTQVDQELRLHDEDFPAHYAQFAHPQDYEITHEPIPVEYIYHERRGSHSRLLLRCSIKLMDGEFLSASFVVHTGAPKFYLCDRLSGLLTERGLCERDSDLGVSFITLFGRKYLVERTPEGYHPANLIGVKPLLRWGLCLHDEPTFGFSFAKTFSFLVKEDLEQDSLSRERR